MVWQTSQDYKGKAAEKLLTKITQAENEKEIQLLLAKVTGNFKGVMKK